MQIYSGDSEKYNIRKINETFFIVPWLFQHAHEFAFSIVPVYALLLLWRSSSFTHGLLRPTKKKRKKKNSQVHSSALLTARSSLNFEDDEALSLFSWLLSVHVHQECLCTLDVHVFLGGFNSHAGCFLVNAENNDHKATLKKKKRKTKSTKWRKEKKRKEKRPGRQEKSNVLMVDHEGTPGLYTEFEGTPGLYTEFLAPHKVSPLSDKFHDKSFRVAHRRESNALAGYTTGPSWGWSGGVSG